MPSSFGSWLSGPPPVGPGPTDQRPNDYPGQRLGLPQSGPESLARMGRRIGALFVDWLIAYGLAALAMTFGWFSVQIAVRPQCWSSGSCWAPCRSGCSASRRASSRSACCVVPVDNRLHVGFGRALARGVLIAFVVPPLFTDTDLRGMHDRLTKPPWCGAAQRLRTVRWTPRIFACAGIGPFGIAAGPTLEPSAASRDSSASICLTVMLRAAWSGDVSSLASGTSPSPLPITMS